MVVAMRTATARLLRWGSKSNAPRVWVRGHGLCVQLRAVKQAVKFGNLEKWKFWTRFWNAKKWHMHTSTCLKHLASLDLFHLYNLYIYIYMTVVRKACSQNRPNNAFPCVTPILLNKKHTCLTIIKSASETTKASISQQQCTCADFFSVKRVRRGGWTTTTILLLLLLRRDVTSLLAFLCLSFTAMRCLPFLLHCVDKFLSYFASFLSKEVIICLGVRSFTSPKCIFLLARGLRAACARNAT